MFTNAIFTVKKDDKYVFKAINSCCVYYKCIFYHLFGFEKDDKYVFKAINIHY